MANGTQAGALTGADKSKSYSWAFLLYVPWSLSALNKLISYLFQSNRASHRTSLLPFQSFYYKLDIKLQWHLTDKDLHFLSKMNWFRPLKSRKWQKDFTSKLFQFVKLNQGNPGPISNVVFKLKRFINFFILWLDNCSEGCLGPIRGQFKTQNGPTHGPLIYFCGKQHPHLQVKVSN